MVDTLWLVLGGLAIYTAIAMGLQRFGVLPEQMHAQGPILTLHTQYGKEVLDRLASPKRFWRAWGNIGLGITLVVMVGSFVGVILSGILAVSNPQQPSQITEPQNFLVIPGVNDFLPLSVAPEIVLGLLLGLVVHEGGHGLFCRVGDIDIDSMGLALLAIIPIGAFVEPKQESQFRADRGSQTRMFAAGVTNNYVLSIIGFILLFGPVAGSVAVAPGAPVGDVVDGSPAAKADIDRGDRIIAINNKSLANGSELTERLTEIQDEQVTVTIDDDEKDKKRTVTVDRYLFLTSSTPSVVDINTSEPPPRIQSVAGESVSTRAELHDILKGNPTVTVNTTQGSFELIAGVYVTQAQDNGPFAEEINALTSAEVIITRVSGERVVTSSDLMEVMSNTSPGDTVSGTVYVNGTKEQFTVTLTNGREEGQGYLGIRVRQGTGGIDVDDFGVFVYPAQRFLGALGGDGLNGIREFISQSISILYLPFAGAIGLSSYNFAGFVGPITNFYTVSGPLAFLGGWVFTLANVLFWTGWININLGLFNCIPAFPLDGGHILRTSTEAIVSRLPVSNGRVVTRTITTLVGLSMLTGLLLMVFGPRLLS
jgi:membrane-associated protease RseP (regulator of RpoE activity)